jgi:hypothetical protein
MLINDPSTSKLSQQFLPVIIDLCVNALYPAIREVVDDARPCVADLTKA